MSETDHLAISKQDEQNGSQNRIGDVLYNR